MGRMDLVGVLSGFVGEHQVQGDLVGLVDDGAMAADHAADVVMECPWDAAKVLFCAGDQVIGGVGLRGIGPKNHDVREHEWRLCQ